MAKGNPSCPKCSGTGKSTITRRQPKKDGTPNKRGKIIKHEIVNCGWIE